MTSPIDTLIERASAKKKCVLIIGDGMTDLYVHGRFDTCQEECPKFIEESRVSVPGGASNAGRSIENWNVVVYCFTGDERNKSVKTRYVVDGKYVFRHDDDKIASDSEVAIWQQETIEFLRHGENIHGCLISDYSKGFLTPAFIRQVIDLANERGVPVVADAKRDPELYAGAVLKCNLEYNARFPIGGVGVKSAIITRGGESPFLFDGYRATPLKHPWNKDIKLVNHVGAGDCFAAHLTLALAHGLPLEDAAAIAHSAGRCYVQAEHNRPPAVGEIRADMSESS